MFIIILSCLYHLPIEMIVLSDGNNVAPVHIEAMIKKEAPFLSNVVLVGDGRDYLCCLMTLKVCVKLKLTVFLLILAEVVLY